MYYSNHEVSEQDEDGDEPANTFSSQREHSNQYKGHNLKAQSINNMSALAHQTAHYPYHPSYNSPKQEYSVLNSGPSVKSIKNKHYLDFKFDNSKRQEMHTLQSATGINKNSRKMVVSDQKDHEQLNHPENSHIHNLIQSNQKKAKQNLGQQTFLKPSLQTSKGQVMKNNFMEKK